MGDCPKITSKTGALPCSNSHLGGLVVLVMDRIKVFPSVELVFIAEIVHIDTVLP